MSADFTNQLQLIVASIHKLLKNRMLEKWNKWMAKKNFDAAATRCIKSATISKVCICIDNL